MKLLISTRLKRYFEIALQIVSRLLLKYLEQDMATFVKKKCDEEFGGTWHCVVGRNFGCSITHDTKYVLFIQIDQMHVLLFKSLE
jgi:dynein light chain LC8-type